MKVRKLFGVVNGGKLFPVLVATAALLGAAPAGASVANVSIVPGGLTLSSPSITVVGRKPVELDVRTSVIDARGTGAGWFVSLAADAPGGSNASNLVVTDSTATCLPNSACTLPVNQVSYPVTAGSTGTRSKVFEAKPGTGLGAESIDIRAVVPSNAPEGLRLSFSISTEP